MKSIITKKKFSLLHYTTILKKLNSNKKIKIFDADVNQSIIEEITGNLSSSMFIGLFAVVGGSVALFAHPIIGTTILFFSIVYGSVVKVCAGKYYRKRNKIYNDSSNKELTDLLKSKKNIIPCIRTDTSKYAFVRVLSPIKNKTFFPSSPIMNKSFFLPSPKNCLNRRIILPPLKISNNKKIVPLE
tara:strand:+ start:4854 stop:5411 length:558 start_codon:yes stop_codon:yes gene_type:complete